MTDFTEALLKRRKLGTKTNFAFPAGTISGHFEDVRHWVGIIEQRTEDAGHKVEFTPHQLRRLFAIYATDKEVNIGEAHLRCFSITPINPTSPLRITANCGPMIYVSP